MINKLIISIQFISIQLILIQADFNFVFIKKLIIDNDSDNSKIDRLYVTSYHVISCHII